MDGWMKRGRKGSNLPPTEPLKTLNDITVYEKIGGLLAHGKRSLDVGRNRAHHLSIQNLQ